MARSLTHRIVRNRDAVIVTEVAHCLKCVAATDHTVARDYDTYDILGSRCDGCGDTLGTLPEDV